MFKSILVAFGGAAGAMARYWLSLAFNSAFGVRLPFGTFIVNITGSFVIGFLMVLLGEQLALNPNWRLLFGVGFIGAYTTFSTFEYETLRLVEEGRFPSAALYVVLSLVVGFAAVWVGCLVARRFQVPPEIAARLQGAITQFNRSDSGN